MSGWRFGVAALIFVLLATANSGGYRYGVSDQAFYQPAIVHAIDPATFPRDREILATQTPLTVVEDLLAFAARTTGVSLPVLFAAVYVAGLLLLAAAAAAFARAHGLSTMATTAFLLLLTLRHRIPKTGANSLEGYMHPRMVAFAVGLAALAAVVRGRLWLAAAGIGIAGLLHPTTALWFGVCVAVAATQHPITARWARIVVPAAALAGAAWAFTAGPLAGRLVTMDPAWLEVIASKDYLFPTDWPVYAWVLNLAYLPAIVVLHGLRRRAGHDDPGERALVAGLAVLFVLFAISVPLTWSKLAVAVQFQVTRVFWVMDAVLAAYVAWWLVDRLAARGPRPAAAALAIVAAIGAASAARGVYLLTSISDDRHLVRIDLPPTPWTDVMRWLRTQPVDWHVLADPDHGWKYGSSVRVAGERDTVLEAGKDTSMAMYDRDVAMRVRDRLLTLSGFETLMPEAIRSAATRYDADVVLTRADRPLPFPELYRNAGFAVYDLR